MKNVALNKKFLKNVAINTEFFKFFLTFLKNVAETENFLKCCYKQQNLEQNNKKFCHKPKIFEKVSTDKTCLRYVTINTTCFKNTEFRNVTVIWIILKMFL